MTKGSPLDRNHFGVKLQL